MHKFFLSHWRKIAETAFSSRESVPRKRIVDFTAFASHRYSRNLFTRRPIYVLFSWLSLFGHHIRKVFSENLCRCTTKRIWLRVFRRQKRKKKKEIWSTTPHRLGPGMKILFALSLLREYLRHYFVPLSAKARPTYAALFFTRKTPLRRNSARWITPARPPPPSPSFLALFKKRQRRQLGVRAVRDTGSKRITLRMRGKTKLPLLLFSRFRELTTKRRVLVRVAASALFSFDTDISKLSLSPCDFSKWEYEY